MPKPTIRTATTQGYLPCRQPRPKCAPANVPKMPISKRPLLVQHNPLPAALIEELLDDLTEPVPLLFLLVCF